MLIPDHETVIDLLNWESISTTVVEILADSRDRPLTVGIHGDWGAGKTSILRMVESQLRNEQDIATLWFNGWAFEGFKDTKSILIESTILEVSRQRSTVGKVKELGASLLRRINWLSALRLGSGIAIPLILGMPSPDQIAATYGSLQSITEQIGQLNPDQIQAEINDAASILKPEEEPPTVPEQIHVFREEFQELLDEAGIDQLVVLIDDLDRCLPATTIQTLEAIRLFLFVPKTAFVLAADEAMIEYAVSQHFPDLPDGTGALPYSRNYLEKLIQVPFRIPKLGVVESRTYITLLLVQNIVGDDDQAFHDLVEKAKKGMSTPWIPWELGHADVVQVSVDQQEALNQAYVLAQQIGPILSEGSEGNPRQIKRFLNTLSVRQMIATAGGYGQLIGQSVLAKLMLAERFQPDFYENIAAQATASPQGLSTDLVDLEALVAESAKPADKEQDKSDLLEDGTTSTEDLERWIEKDWLRRWLTINPALSSVDLRPYIFVARDKRLAARAQELGGLEALIESLSGPQLLLRQAEPDVQSLPAGDASTVFSALRDRVLSADSLENPPPGFDGMGIVGKHHAFLQSELIAMVEALDPNTLGIWIVRGWDEVITGEEERGKLIQVLESWSSQDENALLQSAASAAMGAISNTEN